MATCLISNSYAIDCANKPVAGVEQWVILYNLSDWRANEAGVTKAVNGTITAIVNQPGIAAFRFDMPGPSNLVFGSTVELNDGGFPGWMHTVNMNVVATDQDAKNDVMAMLVEPVVVLVMKNDGTGEVYGNKHGLKLQNTTYNPNDRVTGGTIPIELSTPTTGGAEPSMPITIDTGTGEADNRALIAGLTTIGV